MFQVVDVYNELLAYNDLKEYSITDLNPCCEKGLQWTLARLRQGVAEDDPLIVQTAAAMAHYYFYFFRMGETDKYDNSKVGDITIKRNLAQELGFEKELLKQALADAAPILRDGGFYFCGK